MDFNNYMENFGERVSEYLPGILGALLILLIGWLIASALGKLTEKLIKRSGLEERIDRTGRPERKFRISKIVGKFVYYLLLLIVLLIVLDLLGVSNVLRPVENMLNSFLGFLPNLIAAIIIAFAGYVVATIASELVGLASAAIESFAIKMGLDTTQFNLVRLIQQIVFLLVFIPILITALDTLKLDAISEPATRMLDEFLNAIPNIIAAVVILGVAYILGKYVTQLLTQLLQNLGVDNLSARLRLNRIIGVDQSLSSLLGNIAFFFIVFFGLVSAVEKLEFYRIAEVLRDLLELSGQIFFGLIVIAIGNFIANIAYDAINRSEDGKFLASVARVAILGLFLAIALNMMGIADEIVNLAFGLILGAVAVAVALSFGLGGREAAGKQMEYILRKFRKGAESIDTDRPDNPPAPPTPPPPPRPPV